MSKVHTRQKRYQSKSKGRNRKKRLKSFKSFELAKAYAEKQGFKDFDIKESLSATKNERKFRIIL